MNRPAETIEQLLKKRILVIDGAMGTMVQDYKLDEAGYRGTQFADFSAIMAQALADRLAEAFAELLHKQAREDWGFGQDENLSMEDLIHVRYRGIRPAPGYPACPDHTEKQLLFNVLNAERLAGIRLTENFAMLPASSVCGFYFAHPESSYFALGKIGRDQVLDYASRKGVDPKTVERWLSSNLAYEVK
jgi:5-methyltetrahydrofolate--homocysteine methyltransferase